MRTNFFSYGYGPDGWWNGHSGLTRCVLCTKRIWPWNLALRAFVYGWVHRRCLPDEGLEKGLHRFKRFGRITMRASGS